MNKTKTTKILECRYNNCSNTEEVAETTISVICAPCTFKISEGLLEYSK